MLPSYFICVAKNLKSLLPLPRQGLSDLTTDQLRVLCTRHYRSILNLSLPEPKVKRSKIIPLSFEGIDSRPLLFSTLLGGRQALITFQDGLVQLRDLVHEQPLTPRSLAKCYAVENNERAGCEPVEVGDVLASFHLEGEAWDYDYTFHPDGSIVFGIALQPA